MRKIFLVLSAIILAGCATESVTTEHARPVPAERILASGNGSSTITVTRDKGWFAGGGCFVELTVDGKSYARIDTGETVNIKVEPGRHILGISGDSQGKGLCGFKVGQPLKETSTNLSISELQKFRITGDANSGLDIRPTAI
ncbi:hypothetical protein [[Enterobacter] lignolyticus]|uniref:Lipoprotein n=1 Tax=Enterobacter lignolyticus (strain SCF1) TaxID=701347 RepID=E3G2V4_ENTLS|nr:hypothetical protein [[Enterobacter] lignolyticus]ADO48135.1 hypothetical protein Entcl_1879 [[Enterobacter] lignolyticus SCF1]